LQGPHRRGEGKNERCDAAAEHSEVNPPPKKAVSFGDAKNKLIYQLFAQCCSLQGPHRRGVGKDAVKRSGCVNPAKCDLFIDFISEISCGKNERRDAVAEHSEVNLSLSA